VAHLGRGIVDRRKHFQRLLMFANRVAWPAGGAEDHRQLVVQPGALERLGLLTQKLGRSAQGLLRLGVLTQAQADGPYLTQGAGGIAL
jgi:hypothetical protein